MVRRKWWRKETNRDCQVEMIEKKGNDVLEVCHA